MTGSYYYGGGYDTRKDDLHSVLEISPAIDYVIQEFEKKQQRRERLQLQLEHTTRQSLSTQDSCCSSLGGGGGDDHAAPSTPIKNSILGEIGTNTQTEEEEEEQQQQQIQKQQWREYGSTEEQNSISLPIDNDHIIGDGRGLFSFVFDMAGGMLSCGGCSETH